MLTSILTTASLLASAMSIPLSPRQTSQVIVTGMTAVRSASPIHFEPINATDNHFWIGKPTTTFCPYQPPDQTCNYPNDTAISVYPQAQEYQVYMDANVAGGQNVYVGPTGALSFTPAHGEYVFPNGSYTNGFEYTTNQNNVSFLTFTNGGAEYWFACPASEDTPTSYQVFANVAGFTDSAVPTGKTSDCLEFGILVANPSDSNPDSLAAWQYS